MHFSKARKLLFLHELYFLWMLASMINTYSNSTITIHFIFHFCYLISISNILTSDIYGSEDISGNKLKCKKFQNTKFL